MAGQTTKEYVRPKYRRMNLIRDKLKEKPMSFLEIAELFSKGSDKASRRSVQNYLAELKALKVIIHDEEKRLYFSAECKRVFQSRQDYDIALTHSRNLLFSTKDEVRLVQINLGEALERIARKDTHDSDLYCFSQHLKSGYPEVYGLIEKYHKHTRDGTIHSRYFQEGDELDPKLKKEETMLKRIDCLRASLFEEISAIINKVQNGTPLQGLCDYCPDREITIKDSQ
jgi:hypothetical protein